MPAKESFNLLKKTPPFSFLDDAVLNKITGDILVAFHPKGHTILHQNGPAAEHLGFIRSGAVKIFVRTNEGEELLVDYRTDGDFFGLLSCVYGDVSKDTIVAT